MDLSSAKFYKANSTNNVSFSGKKVKKDDKGNEVTRFYLPPQIIMEKGDKLDIEFIPFVENGTSYTPNDKVFKPFSQLKNKPDNNLKEFREGKCNYVDISVGRLFKQRAEYGYRFVLEKKDGTTEYYADNIGSTIKTQYGEFSVASTKQGIPETKGLMYHAFIDSYNTDEAKRGKFKRNHFNRAGGNVKSLTNKLENSNELDQYEYIMTTPVVGGDKSAHGYHPENFFHITRGMGNVQDFKDLQISCFNKGKGYVLDGAFTSQGYQGIQFNHVLSHSDSPFKYWFKNPGDGGISLGALSDIQGVNKKYAGIRIVNPPNDPDYQYDKTMPTYIQVYDTRLASENQLEDKGKLIEEYDIDDAKDPYQITTWHDGILPNWFEIDPSAVEDIGKKSYASYQEWDSNDKIKKLLHPRGENFNLDVKGKVGGTTGWDGNIDLVKSNASNHINDKRYIEGAKQVRNQIFNVATYWSELTRDTLIKNVADSIHGLDDTKKSDYLRSLEAVHELDSGALSGIDTNNYDCNVLHNKTNSKDAIQEAILKFPFESLNFSNDLLSVLSTSYITPRPSADGDPAASKAEILKDSKKASAPLLKTMDKVYGETLPELVTGILSDIQSKNEDGKKIFSDESKSNLTEYGKYVLQMATPEIMQFAVTEGLFGKIKNNGLIYEDGQIAFDKLNSGKLNLKKLGAWSKESKVEAQDVANKLNSGIKNIDSKKLDAFKTYLKDKYTNTSLEEYKMADAIIDQTGAGLNWRFDAAKDVADWDEVKSGKISSENAWDDTISFWKPFVRNVRNVNPSSYIVAEVTSLHDFNIGNWGKYKDADTAEKIFYEETGATTGSNYSTFFGAYPKLFGKNIEEGAIQGFRSIQGFLDAAKGFCLPGSEKGHMSSEFAMGSHVFLDNHDKPRAAHLMAVDAELFWANFNDKGSKEKAEKYLGREYNDNMSSKAVAVAEQYYKYLEKEGGELGIDSNDIGIIKKAVTHLANGYQYGMNADSAKNIRKDEDADFKKADAFGSLPFEDTIPHVIEQAKAFGLKADDNTLNQLRNNVFADMVAPYESKMPAIYELMAGTAGIPTMFAGDELSQTGAETKSKNWALGCRGVIHHEWLDTKEHVKKFNNRIKATGMLSKQKGLSALSDGTPVFTPVVCKGDILDVLTKDAIVNGLTNVINIDKQYNPNFENTYNCCSFLDCYKGVKIEDSKTVSVDEVLAELKKMDEKELIDKFKARMTEFRKVNKGCADWVLGNQNVGKYITLLETGAILKYNDKGDNVITMVTNAFIPKEAGVCGLNSTAEEPAKISDTILKDDNGKLLAKTGDKFQRLKYSESEGKYVNAGIYKYNNDGKLVPESGASDELDSTVTYFYKIK